MGSKFTPDLFSKELCEEGCFYFVVFFITDAFIDKIRISVFKGVLRDSFDRFSLFDATVAYT